MTLKRKLTVEEKQQIYSLHNQGLTGPEIANHMHIDDARQVVGVVRAGVNFKKLPSMTPPPRQPGVPIMMNPPASPPPDPILQAPQIQPQLEPAVQMGAAAPAFAAPPVSRPVHVPQAQQPQQHPEFRALPPVGAPAQPAEGFGAAWAPVAGFASGFNYQVASRKYMVYRLEPNDGLLGEHVDPFDEKMVASTYGSGHYRVQRFDPGNPRPFQVEFRISQSYGEPRFAASRSQAAPSGRPGYGRYQGRSWMRPQEPREEAGVEEPRYDDRPRPSAYDWARHQPSSAGDATAQAIKALGDANLRALDQAEQARKQGPDSFVTKFFGEQQGLWQRQLEEQRRQDDQRRRDEDEKWERRQKEAELEHKRRQDDEERRHDREIQKIKAETESRTKAAESERKMLLDLEASKLKVVEEQNKLRQDALQDELLRSRQEQKDHRDRLEKQEKERAERIEKQLSQMQEATTQEIEETRARLEAQMQRDREALEREHKLKEKAQDKEHELNTKILDVKQEAMQAQGTNEIFQVVNNVINKFSSGLKEIVDLKKIEAAGNMSPEAQAAAVSHTMGDKKTETPEPPQAQGAAQAAQAPGTNGNGNGKAGGGQAAATAAAPEAQKEPPMEEIVASMVEQPFFQKVLTEWAKHVKAKQNATTFVNMYLEWMRDPADHEGRKATTMFANFIAVRDWAELYAIIKPKLKPEIVKIFDTEEAAGYYETFRALVTEQISAYWEQFAEERETLKAARRAAGKAPAPTEEAARK